MNWVISYFRRRCSHFATALLLFVIAACGGGGGGVGGGLIPGLMSMNTTAVMSGGTVQVVIQGGLAPLSYSIYQAPVGTVIDASGTIAVPNIGDQLDVVIIKVTDKMNRTQYFRVPVVGRPKSWFSADKMAPAGIVGGFATLVSNRVPGGNDADCTTGNCPQFQARDAALNEMPSFSFDGVDDYLKFLDDEITGDFTIALVYRSGMGSGAPGDWTGLASILKHEDYGIGLASNGKVEAGTDLGAGVTNYTPVQTSYANNQGHIILLTRSSGGDSRLYADAVGQGAAASGSDVVAATETYLGSAVGANAPFFLGSIPEVITYARDLSSDSADRIILIRYLKERYGVALPPSLKPTVTIDSGPGEGTSHTTSDFTFTYTYTGSGYADIQSVECQFDNGAWFDCRNPDRFADNYSKSYLNVVDRAHSFAIRVTDTDQKVGSATRNWISDSTAPICSIVSPVDGSWTDTAAVTVIVECVDYLAITPECSVDGGAFGACTSNTLTATDPMTGLKTYTITYDVPGPALVTGDVKVVSIQATDSLGNGPGAVATTSWTTDRENPSCTFTAEPSGVRTASSETIQFTCNDAPAALPVGTQVQCSFNGADFSDCDSNTEHALSNLIAKKDHTLSVKVEDQSGKWSTPITATWTTDLAQPTCSFTEVPGTYGGLDPQVIKFSCSDDVDTNLTYQCRVDKNAIPGAWGACSSATTFNVDNDTEGAAYTVHVKAIDDAARESSVIQTGWTCDLVDPVCSINVGSSAGHNPPEYDQTAYVYYSCSDSTGAMPMDRADCSLDGGAFATCSNTFSAGTGVKSGHHYMTGLSGGNHTLAVRGYDSAGRHHEVTHSWRNDIGRPTCTIVTAISGDRKNASELIDVRCDDDIALNDPSDQKPQCKLDDITSGTSNVYNGDCGATVFGGSYNATATYNTGALTDGRDYRLTVSITDSGGKTPVTDAVTTWTTDTSVPVCTITTSPDGLVHTWNYEDIAFICDDNSLDFTPRRNLVIECEIDGGGFAPCDDFSYQVGTGDYRGTHQFPGLLVGDHILKIRATDSSGNISTENVGVTTASFNTDLADPVCSITVSPPVTGSGYSNDSTPTFNFICTDDNDPDRPRLITDYECLLNDVIIGAGCGSMTTHTLAALGLDGQYKFDVRVTDVAGKVSAAESVTWDYDGTKPTCSITSGQSGYMSHAQTTLDFSCTDPIVNLIQSGISNLAQYECKLDGASWGSCDAVDQHTYNPIADGSHTFYLRVSDDAGNLSSEYNISWITDDTLPVVNSVGLSRPACSTCQAGYANNESNIEVTYSYTEVNPKNLCISEDPVIGNCAWGTDYTSPNSFNLTAGEGVKTVYVWMKDQAGNNSAAKSQTIELDKTAPNTPTVTIDGGASYATALGVSVGFTSTDSNGNSSDVCHRLDTTVGSCSWTTNVISPDSFNLAAIADGNQTIYTWIRDKAGNISNYGSDSIYLDRNAPVCSISTAGGYKTSTTVGITYNCSDTSSSGVATRQCKLDSGSWLACSTSTTHSFSGLSQGAHTLRVRAIDNAGNIGAEDNIVVTVDTVNPTITGISTSRASSTQRQISFTAGDVTSGVNTIKCSINGGAYSNCTSPKVVAVSPGSSTSYRIQVTDNAGHTTTSALYTDKVLYNARSEAECTSASGTSGYGTHNYCQFTGATCAGWSIVTRRYNLKTCTAGTQSCDTDSASFYASAPTCNYNNGWNWVSYGNPAGLAPGGTTSGTSTPAVSCSKTTYTCTLAEAAGTITNCQIANHCCRTSCTAVTATCTADTVNTVRCQ